MRHLTSAELEAGLDHVRRSPVDAGPVELIVRRPAPGERDVVMEATIDLGQGMVGDGWSVRGSRQSADGADHPGRQLTVMNSRMAALVAGDPARRQLAGDQLYVDLDLSHANLAVGTHLAVGSAVIEVTDQVHRGCRKFADRFGPDAFGLVNSVDGRRLRLRGLNARVVVGGVVRVGDAMGRLPVVVHP